MVLFGFYLYVIEKILTKERHAEININKCNWGTFIALLKRFILIQ